MRKEKKKKKTHALDQECVCKKGVFKQKSGEGEKPGERKEKELEKQVRVVEAELEKEMPKPEEVGVCAQGGWGFDSESPLGNAEGQNLKNDHLKNCAGKKTKLKTNQSKKCQGAEQERVHSGDKEIPHTGKERVWLGCGDRKKTAEGKGPHQEGGKKTQGG